MNVWYVKIKKQLRCVNAWTDYADFTLEKNEIVRAEVAYVRSLSLKSELYKARNEYGKL